MDCIKMMCVGCKADLTQTTAPNEGSPCPHCSSTQRAMVVSVGLGMVSMLRLRIPNPAKRNRRDRYLREEMHGDEFHRKSGRWVEKRRIIDRRNDRYEEVITDPDTGQVIHECREALSAHQGHGDAKKAVDSQSRKTSESTSSVR